LSMMKASESFKYFTHSGEFTLSVAILMRCCSQGA